MPLYKVKFRKGKKYWWDEDMHGSCVFAARNDRAAARFAATATASMNRKYGRIGEPREIYIDKLWRMRSEGFRVVYVRVRAPLVPWKQFKKIRVALEAFYPKSENGRRECLAHCFADFKPLPRPRMAERAA